MSAPSLHRFRVSCACLLDKHSKLHSSVVLCCVTQIVLSRRHMVFKQGEAGAGVDGRHPEGQGHGSSEGSHRRKQCGWQRHAHPCHRSALDRTHANCTASCTPPAPLNNRQCDRAMHNHWGGSTVEVCCCVFVFLSSLPGTLSRSCSLQKTGASAMMRVVRLQSVLLQTCVRAVKISTCKNIFSS